MTCLCMSYNVFARHALANSCRVVVEVVVVATHERQALGESSQLLLQFFLESVELDSIQLRLDVTVKLLEQTLPLLVLKREHKKL